jgi:hypothetical protein
MHIARYTSCPFLLLALLASRPELGNATEPFAKVGTYALPFLKFNPGLRSMAMGNLGVADDSDPLNQFFNPANLTSLEGLSISYGHVDYGSVTEYDDVSAFAGTHLSRQGSILTVSGGLRYTRQSIEPQVERTPSFPEGTGRVFDASDRALSLVLAGGLKREMLSLGLGVCAKSVHSLSADNSVDVWAFDLGLLTKAQLPIVWRRMLSQSLGISVGNVGASVKYDDGASKLPTRWRFGTGTTLAGPPVDFIGRKVPIGRMSVVGEYMVGSLDEELGFGLELGVVDLAFFRIGYLDAKDDQEDGAWTKGGGMRLAIKNLRVTASYGTYRVSPVNAKEVRIEGFGVDAAYMF